MTKELNRAFPKEKQTMVNNWHRAINDRSLRQHLQLKKTELSPGCYHYDLIDTRTNQPIAR